MTTPSLRSLAISLAALALVAGPTWSARVVQIRVGDHPTFTRVVFELDAKAGYQIERREVDGELELVVKLDAASKPRELSSKSPMIAGVEVEPSGDDSVARVRLRRSAPLVKEMILTNPPRIVLDLVLPDDLAKAAAAPKKKKAPAPETAAAPGTTGTRTTPEPRVVAQKDALNPSRSGAEPKKTGTGAAPSETRPARKPAAPIPKATPPEAAVAEPKRVEPPAPSPRPVAAPPAPAPGAGFETALQGERIVEPKPAPADEGAEDAEAPPVEPARPETLPPVAKPPQALAPKPIAKAPATPAPTPAEPGLSLPFGLSLKGSDSWLAMGVAGAGVLIFAIMVARLLRRNSRPTSLDALGMGRSQGEPGEMSDPFATDAAARSGAGFGAAGDAFPPAGRGLFDDESEKGDMEMAAHLPIERERTRMSPPTAGADSDLGPLVRELERRLGQLESRLDQVNEARERLERQVTAQSEELRVQRAAIARTQRALRGMSRGGEEQATEPALRDPSKPPVGRS